MFTSKASRIRDLAVANVANWELLIAFITLLAVLVTALVSFDRVFEILRIIRRRSSCQEPLRRGEQVDPVVGRVDDEQAADDPGQRFAVPGSRSAR